ncbi:BgTH12-02553 [Blumeria graminis f. sp. triticale]|uniref:BgTH12-02553 n=1 Tax=Blumeria graminis f. sp. triticale TaxID=1689686 RepID=A0A9W4D189_BLUGR|nr:BgTH12-02553 [Blumeria graminis f. sp. triticale]
MRKQHFYHVVVLLNACSRLDCSTPTFTPMQAEDLDKITNSFVCDNSYYSSKNVQSSYMSGCNELWNSDSSKQFPATLEDSRLYSGIHETLFSWPLKGNQDTFDIRFAGNFRVVFDVRCRFYGVVMRRETNHEHCIELSEKGKANNISPGLKEYKGYRCMGTIFTESYVRSSAIASWQVILGGPDAHRYPFRVSSPNAGQDLFEWPLLKNDEIYGINDRKKRRLIYFVWHKNKGDPIQVIYRSKKLSYTCQFITMNIVPRAHFFDSIGAHELMVNKNKKSYDCHGQTFTDYYIKEIQFTIKNVQADSHSNKFKKNKYPRQTKIDQIESEKLFWIWHLRSSEADFQMSNIPTRYFLIMNLEYEIIGVYYMKNTSYTKCNEKSVQTISEANNVVSSLDLNNDHPCCERCKDPTGCSCEENWHAPKRQKISYPINCSGESRFQVSR